MLAGLTWLLSLLIPCLVINHLLKLNVIRFICVKLHLNSTKVYWSWVNSAASELFQMLQLLHSIEKGIGLHESWHSDFKSWFFCFLCACVPVLNLYWLFISLAWTWLLGIRTLCDLELELFTVESEHFQDSQEMGRSVSNTG